MTFKTLTTMQATGVSDSRALGRDSEDSVSRKSVDSEVRSSIDTSCRNALLAFCGPALAWLLASLLLCFLNALQLLYPSFFSGQFGSFGKSFPLAQICGVYGWLVPSLVGVSIWCSARSSGVAIGRASIPLISAALWNAGLGFGVARIVLGGLTEFDRLGLPICSYVMFGFSGFLMSIWFVFLFSRRGLQVGDVFTVSALLWYSFVSLGCVLLLSGDRLTGVAAYLVSACLASSIYRFLCIPLTIGVLCFVFRSSLRRPLRSSFLGGVWVLMYFMLEGLRSGGAFVGGPFPLWMTSLGAGASVLLVIPVVGSFYNIGFFGRDGELVAARGAVGCFLRLSIWSCIFCFTLGGLASLRSVGSVVSLSMWEKGLSDLCVLLGGGSAFFGAFYFIAPRLFGCEWISVTLSRVHFFLWAYGAGIFCCASLLVGASFAGTLRLPSYSFLQAIESSQVYFVARLIGIVFVIISTLPFMVNAFLIVLGIGMPPSNEDSLDS
jgi:cytochrome c oxidase cbb3-type subunit 1